MIFGLLAFFATKPALKLCFHIMDVKMELCEELQEEDLEEKEFDDVEEDKIVNHVFVESGHELIKQVAVLAKCNSYLDDHIPGIFIPPPEIG